MLRRRQTLIKDSHKSQLTQWDEKVCEAIRVCNRCRRAGKPDTGYLGKRGKESGSRQVSWSGMEVKASGQESGLSYKAMPEDAGD